jgi:hypothetical protein
MKRNPETRYILSDIAVKKLVEKASNRSIELNGKVEWAFVTGYLASALATVASMSPASLKELEGMVK